MQTIGFIGIGVMGNSMAGHLLKAGYDVHVYNRSKAKADSIVASGARWHESIPSLANAVDVIITMVGYPRDVEEVYLSPDGILSNMKTGGMVIDMTTSSPDLAKRIAVEAERKGILSLDAPVSGGDIGAKNATLTIMCGGSEEVFHKALPIFQRMGKTIVLQGGPGSGQHTKMANQIAIAGSLCGTCESMTYAKANGLDPVKVLESISSGSAGSWQLLNLAPKMIMNDFKPGFYIKHFLKDLRIALEAAKTASISLPVTTLAERFFQILSEKGNAESGTQALYLLYQDSKKYGL